jgi:protocatechuate 3,4-dioxygenase beta subunit
MKKLKKIIVADAQPQAFHIPVNRRRFFKSMAIASAGFTLPGYLAEALTLTPQVTQGPYYPLANNVPLDKDNDLVQLNDNTSIASGIVTWLSGRVLDASGSPIRSALIELWHADRQGAYIYSASASRNSAADTNFAGFGQFLTGSTGEYKFRTVKAGLYNGRTRHYHIAVTVPGELTRYCSQLFWNETAYDLNGNAWATQNSNDMVFTGITDAAQRSSVNLTYQAVPGTDTGEVYANFDFVRNVTPVEPSYPAGSFVVAASAVAGPTNSTRFKVSIPAYTNYTYEIYGNPSLFDAGSGSLTNIGLPYRTNMSWGALPFSLTQTGVINTNKFTASTNGTLDVYLREKAAKGFYYVSFRVPGANSGTP